jgi:dimethylamine monooxygenase subunit A
MTEFLDTLPEPEISFPVEVPPRVRADLHKLGTVVNGALEVGHFRLDRAYPAYRQRKLELLETRPERCRCLQTHDPDGLALALQRVAGLVEREHPDLAPKLEQGWNLERIADEIALCVQEDLVVVRGALDARAELIHVCFPSRWDPAQKIGHSFMAVHEPVADNAALIAASRNVSRAMVAHGPFVRYVWSLTTDPRLEQHPDDAKIEPDDAVYGDPDALASHTFFRVERQTTFPMPDLDRALFTIRVYMQSLPDAVREPARRARLAAAMREMSPALSDYKGYSRLRDPLLVWLES